MFQLIIMLSRYLFILYIAIFLFQGFGYVMQERGKQWIGSPSRALSIQRIVTVFMHITAFLILAYEPGSFLFKKETLILGAAGLAFLLLANVAASRVYKDGCPLIWNGVLFLFDVGLIMLERLNHNLAVRQLIWMSGGFVVMLFIPMILRFIPKFEIFEKLYIIVSFILIVSTLILGETEFGSTNWIYIGGLSFQPSEVVKFLFIFYLASVFRKRVEWKELIVTAVLSGALVLLLVFQRDLGSALIFFMTYIVMLYIATSNEFLFFGGIGGAAIAATLAYRIFSHVRVRVAAWQNPWRDIDGGGYQIVQSLFAITTWGLLGSGLTKGMPENIPVVERDFIFAAICEELGTLFGIGLICVFIMLFFRGIKIALLCKRRYYSLIAAGIITMLALQSFLILGGVIKLIPLTGVTLPFVSYGGSSVIVSLMMIGLLQWVHAYYEEHDKAGGAEDE